MTKEEKCRKIAEWLEPEPAWVFHGKPFRWESPCWLADGNTQACDLSLTALWQPRDFFASESASAQVLEKMRDAFVVLEWTAVDGWHVGTGSPINDSAVDTFDKDRKTCIAEAALRLIDTPHASGQTR